MDFALGRGEELVRFWRFVAWTLVFVAALVGVAEWYLARKGYAVENAEGCKEYGMYDPYLGWVVRPGRNLTTESAAKSGVYETVWPDTSRASRAQRQKKAATRVLLVGCSHTYGMGVPDEATFAAQLNKRFPDICFDNFGVPAYGTYQSYLRVKQQLLMKPDYYDLVLYCAVMDHFMRNTEWYSLVGGVDKNRYYALNPRVDMDDRGELLFYTPVRRWPGDDLLVSVNFAKRGYYKWLIAQSQLTRNELSLSRVAAFWELNRLMDEQAGSHGAKYGLVWLDEPEAWNQLVEQTERLRTANPWGNPKYSDRKYPYLYHCSTGIANQVNPALHLSNQSGAHFNEKMHGMWAQAIGDWVKIILSDESQ